MRPAFTLKVRFILFFCLLALCTVLVLSAVLHLLRTADTLRATETARYQATRLATQYQTLANALSRNAMAFVASEQPEFEQRYLADLAILEGRAPDAAGIQSSALDRFRTADFDANELALLEEAHTRLLALSRIQREAMGTAKGELDDGKGGVRIALPNALMAKALVFSQQYTEAESAISTLIANLDARQAQRMQQRVQAAVTAGESAGHTAIAAILALMLCSTGALLGLYRSIKRPLDRSVTLASHLSAGNLAIDIERGGKDEMGRLMDALEGIRAGLNQTLCEVVDHFTQVDASAGQLSLSQGAVLQDSHAQCLMATQVSAAMHSLDDAVRQNHDRANEARQLSERSDHQAQAGSEAVARLERAVSDIADDGLRIESAAQQIEEIAFQTNLLALNAAVEAAHAGSHGRGFAIVAAEVRSLAQRCQTATETIQAAVRQAVNNSREGGRLAHDAHQAMAQVVQATERSRTIMDEVTAATQRQAQAIHETAQAAQNLEAMGARGTAQAEGTAQVVAEQRSKVGKLHQTLAQFRLDAGVQTPTIARIEYAQ
ncbi:MAG: hypothetical protein KUL86_15375 [Castellaniella sp.]|nr:hypothetical protein [Castellaniella sp.]